MTEPLTEPLTESPTDHPGHLVELVELVDRAAKAYIRGDIGGYLDLIHHAPDYTLMPPYGGPTRHGFAISDEGRRELSEFFAAGEAEFDLERCYASAELVVLVGVERQHGEVGGTPDQDWSLRVTLVFRRTDQGWCAVHRHADGLVQELPWNLFGALARGVHPDVPPGG